MSLGHGKRTMDWTQRSDYFLESKDGKYRISKASVRQKWVYTAWKRTVRDNETVWMSLLYTKDLHAAHAACEEDAARSASQGR